MISLGLQTLALSMVVALGLTPLLIRFAKRIGAVDHPGPRKVHDEPVPRLGGVAVFVAFVIGVVYAGFASGYIESGQPRLGYWFTLGGCALAMFMLGVWDDVRGLPFQSKFAVQVAASLAVWLAGFRIDVVAVPPTNHLLHLGVVSLPVTALWIVGITNAVNLIDGLDGLATGTALIMTIAVATIALHNGQPGVVGVSVALVGSLLGFLWFNFNPARIFLGDSGSMFLGFVLAVISIHGTQKGATAVAVAFPLLILGFPILDTALAILRRLFQIGKAAAGSDRALVFMLRNAHRVFLPDRGHLHHRLLDLGLSHRGAVLTLYAIVTGLAFTALALLLVDDVWLALLLIGALSLSLASLVAAAVLRGRRPPPDGLGPGGGKSELDAPVAPITQSRAFKHS